MKSLVPIKSDLGVVATKDGKAVVSTRDIAEIFKKEHKSVLRAIENCQCSDEFRRHNFAPSSYKNEQGKKQPEYLLTKDGFAFIVMGFTGKKAAQFKEAYIDRFNKMEQFIKHRLLAKMEFPGLTDAIKMMHEEPKPYHYSNEVDMINRLVLGMSAKQFRLANNLPKDTPIRDHITPRQLELIQKLQKLDEGFVVAIPDYQERKEILKRYVDTIEQKALISQGGVI